VKAERAERRANKAWHVVQVYALALCWWRSLRSTDGDNLAQEQVDQFATPPRWLQFTPTFAHYYDAFRAIVWQYCDEHYSGDLSTISSDAWDTGGEVARFRLRGRLDSVCLCGSVDAMFRR
jgi:hypothetical protein